VDEVSEVVLDGYKRRLEQDGLVPKTIKNRLLIVCFLLKKNGIQNFTKLVEMPTIEKKFRKRIRENKSNPCSLIWTGRVLKKKNNAISFSSALRFEKRK
jgi:hypothetical protein